MTGSASIGVGIGVRRIQGVGAGPLSPLVELSCYATGIWLDGGIWRMADVWADERITADANDDWIID